MMIGTGAETVDWIEVGCTVWSTTHQDGLGFVGGVVIGITEVGDLDVVRSVSPSRGPSETTIPPADVNLEAVTFYTRDASIVARNLFAWLGTQGRRSFPGRAHWAETAVRLASIAEGGPWTPRYEARYQATPPGERSR